jgi:copper homeostasis protein (lipoprotein)
MPILKKSLTRLAVLALFAINTAVFAETTENHDADHAENSIDWPGVYYGFTPCADCKGIKTSLALNSNGSYILMTQFVGKSEREFVEKGKFNWGEKTNTIDLIAKKEATIRHYFVGENALTQLDEHSNFYTGKNAEAYNLRRSEMTEPSKKHSGH